MNSLRPALASCLLFSAAVSLSACGFRPEAAEAAKASAENAAAESGAFVARVEAAAAAAGMDAVAAAALAAAVRERRPEFEAALGAVRAEDPYLTFLVDKEHPLPDGYEPEDLVPLDGYRSEGGVPASFAVNRPGHRLRAPAAAALDAMAAAAREDGAPLVVSSAYRSQSYQETVYGRIVRELGQEAADRESARPGRSQHQLGLAVDFGSISDEFAETAPSRWLEANAGRFGWSLSFPRGYEDVTGYRWESWHYRYVGPAAAALIEGWFGGVQQHALAFLSAWDR